MSYANINDPTAVSALLDQLRASKAWIDLVHEQSPQTPHSDHSSVAALLSQLRATGSDLSITSAPEPNPARQEQRDLKVYTFQQALPVIARLSNDPAFITEIQKLKKAQDDLERHLWEERREIRRKHDKKVNVAKTKASLIGVGISKHEADVLNEAYKKELEKFDLECALPTFDTLVAKQQAALAALNVPTMYVTDDKVAREGQQRIMQVLGGLVETPRSEP